MFLPVAEKWHGMKQYLAKILIDRLVLCSRMYFWTMVIMRRMARKVSSGSFLFILSDENSLESRINFTWGCTTGL